MFGNLSNDLISTVDVTVYQEIIPNMKNLLPRRRCWSELFWYINHTLSSKKLIFRNYSGIRSVIPRSKSEIVKIVSGIYDDRAPGTRAHLIT